MSKVKLGIDLLDKHLDIFKGKRVGLITNPTGFASSFKSTIDVLNEKTNLVALYSPEHGVRGNIQAGVKMDSYRDSETNIMVHSLYGANKRPGKDLMDEIDIMAIDIQDAGSRFYTFIYTMAYAMMACKDFDKEFVVFDRPNPVNADDVEGNILDLSCRSFIGYYPIVQRHGMTIGELALLFNKEYGIDCKLHVIPMENYDRKSYFEDTGCLWIMPSPNFPTVTTAVCYNATCIFEGTNVAEGRGTTAPFEYVGAPYVNPYDYANELNKLGLEGVYFRPLYFTPTFSKYVNETCGGVQVHILDRDKFKPVKTGWAMFDIIRNMYPNDYKTTLPYKEGCKCMLEFNTGCTYIKDQVYTLEEQFKILEKDTEEFKKTRAKYLLY